jgi:thiosulfate dehydrogenase [quinone] large subunit
MNTYQKTSLFLLRISLGWLFLYAGLTKVLNPEWSAAGYLRGASAFQGFYGWLASPGMLPLTNFVNEWGLTLIGVSLLIGLLVRWSAIAGAFMMLMYYLPLGFPYPNEHSFVVEEHVVYMFALLALAAFGAGKVWGLDGKLLAKKRK